jgi:acyl-CoA thioester hydrolase
MIRLATTRLRQMLQIVSRADMTLRFHALLTPEEQIAQGLSAPQPLAMADKVRYGELDPLNHVNNKSYMGWFESVRVEYFRRFLLPLYHGQPAPRTVLRNADIHFIKEMVMGETYVATARVTAFRTASYTMEHQLWSGDLRARMTVVMVMLHPDGSGRYPLPDPVRAHFASADSASSS